MRHKTPTPYWTASVDSLTDDGDFLFSLVLFIANIQDCGVEDVPCISDDIDVGALKKVIESSGGNLRASMTIGDLYVTVYSGGRLEARPTFE